MVIMASASDIAKDMTESIKLIKARLAVDGPDGAETLKLKRKLATSAATKIGHMVALSPAGAEELLEVANGIGYDPAGLTMVVAAIDAKLEEELDAEPQQKPNKKNSCSRTRKVG